PVVVVVRVVVVQGSLGLGHGHRVISGVGDLLVVVIDQVVEDLGGFVRTDARHRLDGGYPQGLVGVPGGDERGDSRPGGAHRPAAGRTDRLVPDVRVRAVQRFHD